MKSAVELQLQKLALALTAIVALQILWSGARLLLLSDPEPILPAEASLHVEDMVFSSQDDDELSRALVSRPLFWQGREAYLAPDAPVETVERVDTRGSKAIDQVVLQGVYTGTNPGIIVSFGGERRRLQLGDAIKDWKFIQLREDGATFRSGQDVRELELVHALSGPNTGDDTDAAADTKNPDRARKEPNTNANNEKTGD